MCKGNIQISWMCVPCRDQEDEVHTTTDNNSTSVDIHHDLPVFDISYIPFMDTHDSLQPPTPTITNDASLETLVNMESRVDDVPDISFDIPMRNIDHPDTIREE